MLLNSRERQCIPYWCTRHNSESKVVNCSLYSAQPALKKWWLIFDAHKNSFLLQSRVWDNNIWEGLDLYMYPHIYIMTYWSRVRVLRSLKDPPPPLASVHLQRAPPRSNTNLFLAQYRFLKSGCCVSKQNAGDWTWLHLFSTRNGW